MTSPPSVGKQLLPLAITVVDILLVILAGLVGGAGMLWAGEWLQVAGSLGAAIALPMVLLVLHWLRLLLDIPAMFARNARLDRVANLLGYGSNVFVHALVLGWLALVFWWLGGGQPSIYVLLWGFAVVSGPLLSVVLRPLGYPMLTWACLVAQLAWPAAWFCAHYELLTADQVLLGIGALTLVSPLIGFSRRWQKLTGLV